MTGSYYSGPGVSPPPEPPLGAGPVSEIKLINVFGGLNPVYRPQERLYGQLDLLSFIFLCDLLSALLRTYLPMDECIFSVVEVFFKKCGLDFLP